MEDVYPPSDDFFMRDRLLEILHRAERMIYLFCNEYFTSLGLTMPQSIVLTYIHHNKGCNQRALEQYLEISSASVTVILNTMEGKGLVVRARNPVDGRGVILSVTAKGRRVIGKSQEAFEQVTEIVCQGISEEEQRTLKRLLHTMVDNCCPSEPGRAASQRTRASQRRKVSQRMARRAD